VLGVALDEEALVAVLVVAPPSAADEWVAYVESIRGLAQRAKKMPKTIRPVVLQVMHEGVSMPTPRDRKMMAELRAEIPRTAVNAVVSASTALRLMATALDWIRKPHYASGWYPDVPSAVAFIEATMGHPVPELQPLLVDATAKARAGDAS
jgi:hypothetical protein